MSDHKLPNLGDLIQGMCVSTRQLYDGIVVQIMGRFNDPGTHLYRLAGTGATTATGAEINPVVLPRHLDMPADTSRLDGLDLAHARKTVMGTPGVSLTSGVDRWHFGRILHDVANGDVRAFRSGERILALLPPGGWIPEPYSYLHAFSNDLRAPVIIGRDDMVFETIDLRDPADKAAMLGRTYWMFLDNGVRLAAHVRDIDERGHLIVTNTVDQLQSTINPYGIVEMDEVR
jgi:hypothetical protein